MLRVILIALLSMFLLSDIAVAQQSSRRGRFFQRVKQDLFGIKPATPTPSKKTNSTNPPATSNKQPTPSRKQPSPTLKFSSNQRPSSLKKPTRSGSKDFGFNVQENDEGQLIVSRIDARGNAAEAGLARGDRIIEVGGIEANSAKELEEISKIMHSGDQMEFKIKRNGREKTLMITYGAAPEPDEENVDESLSKTRRYDFSPPNQNARRGEKSILDSPAPGRSARSIGAPTNLAGSRFPNQNNAMLMEMRGVIERQNLQIRQLQAEIAKLKRYGR